jgi:hypothetical protein
MNIPSLSPATRMIRTMLGMVLIQLSVIYTARAQNRTLEVLDTATLQQQMDHLRDRINIYNGYRAVRDDIFLKMMQNSLDSLGTSRSETRQLESTLESVQADMAAIEKSLRQTEEDRDLAIKNKNSLSLLGLQMNKAFYNSIMWTMVLVLAALLIILFFLYKRSFVINRQISRDLEETKEEYENYRQQSRERYEKMVVQHHKEILKLKGKKPRSIE